MAHKYVIEDTITIHHYGPYTIAGKEGSRWNVVYGGLLSTEVEEFDTLDEAIAWIDSKEGENNG